MNLPQFSLEKPYTIIACTLVVFCLGIIAFWRTPTDLFPETVPPQVAIVTSLPGAAAYDVAETITQVLEKEFGSISGLKHISSTSRDEVSSINVEFTYDKRIGEAVIDVQNAVSRVRSQLPAGIEEPRLYRITDATRPLVTIALTPAKNSLKTLQDLRLLAENDLKDRFLSLDGIGDVQVFGGHQPEVEIAIDRNALTAHGLFLGDIIAALSKQNVAAPGGTVYTSATEHLVRISGQFLDLKELKNLPLTTSTGGLVYLRNLADINLIGADQRSFYHGNGTEAIAMNILRPEKGKTVAAIRNLKQALPVIEQEYPDIKLNFTDDQEPLINLNVSGMRSSLWQAVVLTVFVILIFLANIRAAGIVSVAIPLSFLAAMTVLWFSPYTLNMVTLSGLIVAVGMVVDASVVVLENIYSHQSEGLTGDRRQRVIQGASQVAPAITAGMMTTVVVLLPVLFAKGYTGMIMRPLNIVIISTLVASLLISLTVIPILSDWFLSNPRQGGKMQQRLALLMERSMDFITRNYLSWVRFALQHRALFLLLTLVFLLFTMRIIKPLLGGEQMPPMDTGIAIIEFDTGSSSSPSQVEEVLSRVERMLEKTSSVQTMSSVVGSEVGANSFGSGAATTQSAKITLHLTPRTERTRTIWELEEQWRKELRQIEGVRTFRVSEYGATPVSTTKAPFNIVLSGPDTYVLDQLANKVLLRLKGLPGLQDMRRSWYRDKIEQNVVVDPDLARLYGTSPADVASSLRTAIQGRIATRLSLDGYLDIPIRVRYQADQRADLSQLQEVDVPTRFGATPLANLAHLEEQKDQPFLSREQLQNTIDITAGNEVLTIAQLTELARQRLADLKIPAGYSLLYAGTVKDMADTAHELGQAMVIGLLLLFILLLALFKSFVHPLTIMLSIPLAAAGAMWGLLIFDKPFCMPALMGIILLGGTIVNNAILLLDFIIEKRRSGTAKNEAILQSVRQRIRPILMTAVSTIIGFSPLIFEMAVGLERMSPLGIAAATGLLFGTVITLVIVPVIYSVLDSLTERLKNLLVKRKHLPVQVVLILLIVPLLGSTVRAASLPDTLSLEEAIQIALQNNPELGQAQAQVGFQKGDALVAAAPGRLQVNLESGVSGSSNSHALVPGLDPAEQIFDKQLFQTTLSASYLVTDFGRTKAAFNGAMSKQNSSVLLEQRRRQEVTFAVAKQYLNLVTLENLITATQASQTSLQSLAKTTEQLVIQGAVPNVDQLKVQLQLAEIDSVLVEYRGIKRKGRASLASLLGVVGALPPLDMLDLNNAVLPTLYPTQESEEVQRQDIAALEEDLMAAQFRVKEAQLQFAPKVEFFGTAALYASDDPVGSDMQPADRKWKDDESIGLRIKVPLWDGRSRSGRLIQAKALRQSTGEMLKRKKLVVQEELESAQSDLESTRSQLEVRRKMVEQVRETLRIEHLRYEVGKGTITDVLTCEADLLKAESLLLDAKKGVNIALLALSLARGELSFSESGDLL